MSFCEVNPASASTPTTAPPAQVREASSDHLRPLAGGTDVTTPRQMTEPTAPLTDSWPGATSVGTSAVHLFLHRARRNHPVSGAGAWMTGPGTPMAANKTGSPHRLKSRPPARGAAVPPDGGTGVASPKVSGSRNTSGRAMQDERLVRFALHRPEHLARREGEIDCLGATTSKSPGPALRTGGTVAAVCGGGEYRPEHPRSHERRRPPRAHRPLRTPGARAPRTASDGHQAVR